MERPSKKLDLPSLQTLCTCLSLPFFFLHRVFAESRVTCCTRFVLRIEILFGRLLSGRIAKAGRFIQCYSAHKTHVPFLFICIFVHCLYLTAEPFRYAEIFRNLRCSVSSHERQKVNVFFFNVHRPEKILYSSNCIYALVIDLKTEVIKISESFKNFCQLVFRESHYYHYYDKSLLW